MTPTDKEQVNKELAERLGICWHEAFEGYKDGEVDHSLPKCDKCGKTLLTAFSWNPDFFTDPVKLLRLMRERVDWEDFLKEHTGQTTMVIKEIDWFIRDYILEEGKLAIACRDWIRREK